MNASKLHPATLAAVATAEQVEAMRLKAAVEADNLHFAYLKVRFNAKRSGAEDDRVRALQAKDRWKEMERLYVLLTHTANMIGATKTDAGA